MTDTIFSRNKLYWGEDFQEYLKSLKIAVFGLGGVGGFALEALARAGIGHFLIVDFDTVSVSNINRQLAALHSTIGLKKQRSLKKDFWILILQFGCRYMTVFFLKMCKIKCFQENLWLIIQLQPARV